MKKQFIFLFVSSIIALSFTGCKKSSSDNSSVPAFKADTVFTLIKANAFPNYNNWNSIAIDSTGNKIFFYYKDAVEGFKIDMFDFPTGSTTTIYKHFTQSGLNKWATGNGSDGMRLRYFSNTFDGNKLIVPGGAINMFFIEILLRSDYSTSFLKLDTIPETYNGSRVENCYDADLPKSSMGNLINIVSMWNCVYNINLLHPVYAVSATSHGSSIVGSPTLKEYVFCGDNKSLELYSNGNFVRSVSLPFGEAQLQMDSKKRIYAYNGSSIFRFSPDLFNKEEFPVKGSLEGYRKEALVIKDYANYVQVYSFSQKDLIGMKLPQ